MGDKIIHCEICDKETELSECVRCHCMICEDCLIPYDQFSQIDFNLCLSCGDDDRDE